MQVRAHAPPAAARAAPRPPCAHAPRPPRARSRGRPCAVCLRDVIELLLQTAKKLDKEKELLKVEASDKATALDLAKERKEQLMQQRTDEPDAIESRKNLEKVIEWLDQGLPPE